jgi:hypothetical protein
MVGALGLLNPLGIALDLPAPVSVPALGGWGVALLCAVFLGLSRRMRPTW